MATGSKKWFKWLLWFGLAGLVIGGGIIWYLFTLKYDNSQTVQADFEVEAMPFIQEYLQSEPAANAKYTEKMVRVTGVLSELEKPDSTTNLKMVDSTTGSYIIFAFQADQAAQLEQLKPGVRIAVKGSCSGGSFSEILGSTSITFKRCVLAP